MEIQVAQNVLVHLAHGPYSDVVELGERRSFPDRCTYRHGSKNFSRRVVGGIVFGITFRSSVRSKHFPRVAQAVSGNGERIFVAQLHGLCVRARDFA